MSDFTFGGDGADIPPGVYPARLVGLSVRESDAWGEFRTWDFELDNGSTVGGASSMASGAKSKGGKWAMALLGRKPVQGEKLELVGLRCQVVVVEGNDGWPKVESVIPAAGAAAQVAAEATPTNQSAEATTGDALPF